MASTKAWVSGIATSAALSYVVMLMLRPDEVKIEVSMAFVGSKI